jgi:hypothetical protein
MTSIFGPRMFIIHGTDLWWIHSKLPNVIKIRPSFQALARCAYVLTGRRTFRKPFFHTSSKISEALLMSKLTSKFSSLQTWCVVYMLLTCGAVTKYKGPVAYIGHQESNPHQIRITSNTFFLYNRLHVCWPILLKIPTRTLPRASFTSSVAS